jgi:hypothetical protein
MTSIGVTSSDVTSAPAQADISFSVEVVDVFDVVDMKKEK